MSDYMAVSARFALKQFWDAGFTTERLLQSANDALRSVKQCAEGYYKQSDVDELIKAKRIIWRME